MTIKHFEKLADLQALVGQELAVSDWLAIEQSRIDAFAEATGDHQWIHIDPGRPWRTGS
jgi:acyl dehydratase